MDNKHWGRREWLGTAFLFFFTWLAFFILAINPPISDYAPPRVDLHAGPPVQQAGGPVVVDLFVEDNTRVASHTFRLSQGGQGLAGDDDLVDLGGGHYQYNALLPVGVYDLEASAKDSSGHETTTHAHFAVVETAIKVFAPVNATIDDPTDQVFVQVPAQDIPTCATKKGVVTTNGPCIRTVHLDREDGGHIIMEWSKTDNGWRATSNFAGWVPGPNNVTPIAEVVGSHVGGVFVDGGDITAAPLTIEVDIPTGTHVPNVVNDPAAGMRRVPGLELPVLALGLLMAVAVLRRRA